MKLWKMKKSCDFDHEIMNYVEKNVGTPAILGKTLGSLSCYMYLQGPVLAWLNCIEAYQKLDIEIPINIKFCFEGMEEHGSEGLDELLFSRKDTFLKVSIDLTL
jgi:nonspecific dipeptidase